MGIGMNGGECEKGNVVGNVQKGMRKGMGERE